MDSFLSAWQLSKNDTPDPCSSRMFVLTTAALESNLIVALKTFRQFSDCVEVASAIVELPPVDLGGAYVLLFSLVDWSPPRYEKIHQLERELREQGRLVLPANVSLLTELRRVQQDYSHLQNPFTECVLAHLDDPAKREVVGSVLGMVSLNDSSVVQHQMQRIRANTVNILTDPTVQEAYKKSGIVLLVQYFYSSNELLRNDLNLALQKNLDHPAISEVLMLNEEKLDFTGFRNTWKIRQYVLGRRITFADAFEFANKYLYGRTVILGKL